MAHHHAATARQLDFTYDGQLDQQGQPAQRGPVAKPVIAPRHGAAHLCVVCGRVPAHLTLKLMSTSGNARRRRQQKPARLCLRCHHAVMQQRRMVRAQLTEGRSEPRRPSAGGGLIVPRSSTLTGDRKYRQLTKSRRRAQKAARAALEV